MFKWRSEESVLSPDETQRKLARWNRDRLAPRLPDNDWEGAIDADAQMLRLEGEFLVDLEDRTVTLGTGDNSWSLDAGVGVDYRSSRHIVWSADYMYGRDYAPPVPLNDTHTVSVGVRVNR